MEIAVTRMKNIANLQSISHADFADPFEYRGKFSAWNDTILNIKFRADASYGTECVLASCPQELSFRFIFSNANHGQHVYCI